MKSAVKLCLTLLLISLFYSGIPASSAGQSVWLDPTVEGSSLSLEIVKPDYWLHESSIERPKAYSTVWFLSFRTRMSENIFWLAELPSSHFDGIIRTYCYEWEWDPYCGYEYDTDGQSVIGNPFLGIEYRDPVTAFYSQFGVRVPVTDENKRYAISQGAVSDLSRMGAFLPDVLAVRLRTGVRTRAESGLAYHLFLGPCFWKPVGDLSGADSEVYFDYGGQIWFVNEKARLGAGLVGQMLVTSDGDGLGETSFHQFGVAANYGSGRVRPGAQFRVPLDDDMPGLQFVWGLSLQIRLGPGQ